MGSPFSWAEGPKPSECRAHALWLAWNPCAGNRASGSGACCSRRVEGELGAVDDGLSGQGPDEAPMGDHRHLRPIGRRRHEGLEVPAARVEGGLALLLLAPPALLEMVEGELRP